MIKFDVAIGKYAAYFEAQFWIMLLQKIENLVPVSYFLVLFFKNISLNFMDSNLELILEYWDSKFI
jgi:hypothetical protein